MKKRNRKLPAVHYPLDWYYIKEKAERVGPPTLGELKAAAIVHAVKAPRIPLAERAVVSFNADWRP